MIRRQSRGRSSTPSPLSEKSSTGWPEKLFVRLNGLLPRLVDQALRKQLPVIKRFARAGQPLPPASQPTSTGEHP